MPKTSKKKEKKITSDNVCPCCDKTPLQHICMTNDVQGLQTLLSQGHDPNEEDDDTQSTPLHTAASKGHHEMVKVLLDARADVNATDSKERTPLLFAKYYNKTKAIEVLTSHGGRV